MIYFKEMIAMEFRLSFIARCVLILVASLGGGTSVLAAERGFYAGANIGWSKIDFDTSFSDERNNNVSRGLSLGYRFTPHFGVEAGYGDYGKATYSQAFVGVKAGFSSQASTTGSVSAKGAAISAVASMPNGNWEVFGRAGVWYAKVVTTSLAISTTTNFFPPSTINMRESSYLSKSSFQPLIGFGAGYTFADHYHIKLEWTYLGTKLSTANGVKSRLMDLNTGIQYRF